MIIYHFFLKNIDIFIGLHCLYAPVILIDSVYRKDENYYPKVFLEKTLISLKKYYDGNCVNLFLETL